MAGQCQLLVGPAAALAQVLLAGAAFCALVYKRHKERPQRTFSVWGMDVSKQAVSTVAAHFCGIVIAIWASESGGQPVSQCAWYFVAYTFDTTLGVAIAICLHSLAVRLCRRHAAGLPDGREAWCRAVAKCGDYGTPPRWTRFAVQLVEWTGVVVIARVICGSVVIGAKSGLAHVAAVLDRAFRGHPTLLLFFVMIMCPLLMNLLQALVQDAVLKWRKARNQGGPEAGGAAGEAGEAAAPKRDREDVPLVATQPEFSDYVAANAWSQQRT